MRFIFILISFLFAYIQSSYAVFSNTIDNESAKVTFIAGGYKDNILKTALNFDLKDGWKIYWRSPGDEGLPPKLSWKGSKNLKDFTIKWPFPEYDGYRINEFILEGNVYLGETVLPVNIYTNNINSNTKINLLVNYLACKNSCVPQTASFTVLVPAKEKDSKALLMIEKAEKKVPVNNSSVNEINIKEAFFVEDKKEDKYIIISVDSRKSLENTNVFLEFEKDISFVRNEKFFYSKGINSKFIFKVTSLENKHFDDFKARVTLVHNGKAIEKLLPLKLISENLDEIIPATAFNSVLLLMILLAFVGGMILNVMPCVLPVISIKLMSVIKHIDYSVKQIRFIFFVTALGIISSFIILALFIISFHLLGVELGWGFHFQEPLFIISMLVILLMFAANLLGWYEIHIPYFISKFFSRWQVDNNNIFLSNFFSGFLATALATPCTAPFLGTAVSFALSQGILEIFIIFLFMGIGFASPYIIMIFFPSLVRKLPTPGLWMLKIKYFMAILLLATAIWLIYIISSQLGMLAGLILFSMSFLNIFLIFCFRKNNKLVTMVVGVFLILFLLVAFPFLSQKSSKENYNITEKLWIKFEENKIQGFVNDGNIVFVDITAKWCITCKLNEFLVIKDNFFQKELLKKDFIAMKGDWTKKNDIITYYLKEHSRAGIPFNIVYGPGAKEGILLPELLTEKKVITAIQKARGFSKK